MSFLDRLRPLRKISAKDIDNDAMLVLRKLGGQAFTAYLVGGGVRDLLLGRQPKDFDIVTDARPSQIHKIFRNSVVIGRRFKLVLVYFGANRQKQIETTTFRRDPVTKDDPVIAGDTSDASLYQISDNTFGTPEEDAYRRDFTVNALFWDPRTSEVVDYTGGLRDLKKRTLRCIGDPNIRFREDPVRMLRAIRLSCKLDFSIHSDSVAAIKRHASAILEASKPRLFDEILRLFTFSKSTLAMQTLWELGLMRELLPSLNSYVESTGGRKSPLWRYIDEFDRLAEQFDTEHKESHRYVQENAIRLATLLAPLLRDRVPQEASQKTIFEAARALVSEIVVAPFSTKTWRVPRALCYDLIDILCSLYSHPNPKVRKNAFFTRPWFYTALCFWKIALSAEGAGRREFSIVSEWEDKFTQFCDKPIEPRRGNYESVNPDSVAKTGFPGDVPEDRDSLFPARKSSSRRRPRHHKHSHEPINAAECATQPQNFKDIAADKPESQS